MGKLIRLELFNFKSYKGHHVILFADSYFTSIIGPNGSGKSNCMDAISFVLGIKSVWLRSDRLSELIYRGRVYRTSKINADGTATEGAEETQTNGHVDGDVHSDGEHTHRNTLRDDAKTAWVTAVYEDDAGEEQKWKRTITSTGNSEYRINNRQVSAKQYNDVLEAENILVKARNFLVFQSEVESVAQQSPRDLTKLIEQISGSLEYKEEYERLKVEADKANEDQSFKLNQRRAMNSEIKQYQEQKREAENYERKLAERDSAIVTQVLWKLYHLQQAIEDSKEQIHYHKEELKEADRKVERSKQAFDDAQRDQAKTTREISKLQKTIEKKTKDIKETENSLEPIDEKITVSTRNLEKYQARIRDVVKSRDGQASELAKWKKDLSSVEKAESRWEQEHQRAQEQSGRQLSASDLQEYDKLRTEVVKRTALDQSNIENLNRQFRTDTETVGSLQSKLETTQSEVQKLEEDIAKIAEDQSRFGTQVIQAQKEIDEKKKEINNLVSERTRTAQLRTEKEEKLQDALRKLDEANAGQQESRKDKKLREIVSDMKRLFPGKVVGRVRELCKPKQKKFETAMSVALGRHFDAVIVDTNKTANDCIGYLRDQRFGVLHFIPLDTIQVKPINPNLKGLHRGMRLAIDTIEYDSSVERAMLHACGNTMVCDTVEIARYLIYQKHVDATAVSLDGTKINKNGLMTGGTDGREKARVWDVSEVTKLRELISKYTRELGQLEGARTLQRGADTEQQLQIELQGLERQLAYDQDILRSLNRNLGSRKMEYERKKAQLKEVRLKHQEQSRRLESLRKKVDGFRDTISAVEDQVFASFCKKLGYNSIRDYEALQGSFEQEAIQKRLDFQSNKTRLQQRINYVTQQLQVTEDRISKLRSDAKRDQGSIASLKEDKDAIQSTLDVLNAELEQLNERLAELSERADEKAAKVAEARREWQKRAKAVEEQHKKIADLQDTIQRKSASRYSELRKCRIDEIRIPLAVGSRPLSSLPLADEQDEEGMDIDGNTLASLAEQDYSIQIDFDQLADELKEDNSAAAEDGLQEAISTLNSELDKMAPNMRATDRLSGVEARLKMTDKEFEAARRNAKHAREEFETVRNKRLELFNKAFGHISDQIDSVYKDLTRGVASHMGGQAYLDTEDSEEPYLAGIKYHAMPPLKRFRDMEHLSGGEKTMAALALLFAVHSYQPSPFFVLDEVDAALDNANVAKLVGYIKRNAGPGMQFIVISLKTGLFEGSETLVGVMRDQGVNSSKTLTLDLRKYQP